MSEPGRSRVRLPAVMSAGVLAAWLALPALGAGAEPAPAAKRPADAPADATGLCGDGDYTRKTERHGACRGRNGVKAYWGAPGAPASSLQPAQKASAPAR